MTAGALWLATDQLASTFVVAGESMLPALSPGDRLIIDRWTCRQRLPRPGEIVLVATENGVPMVKRVMAADLDGSGGLWLLGDNPEDSLDSRSLGIVPASRVAGIVRWRYWPLRRGGSLR